VKGTIHWLSIPHARKAEVRVYDRLFRVENPADEEGDFKNYINPDSLTIIREAFIEPSLEGVKPGERFQFIRKGYYCVDLESRPDHLIFNRTVTLKDAWAKEVRKPAVQKN